MGLLDAPTRIAGLYAVAGLLWIWLSDWALNGFSGGVDPRFLAGAIKGTGFVLATALLLYWLIRREVAAVRQSESLLRAVVDGTTDAVFVKDRDGRYLIANEAAARLSNRSVAEVLNHTDRELMNLAEADRVIASDQATMSGGKVINREETITSFGVDRTFLATKAPLRDAFGNVIGLIGVSRDITDRKAMEDALRISEELYRELADAIPQIVWTASPDGAVTHLNLKAVEYSGVAAAELEGWSWQKVIHPDDLTHALTEWSLALESGVPRSFEMRIRRTDGEYRWHIVRQFPIRNAAGVIESWVGTCTDIDDLSRAENSLRETESRLREAQRIARLGSWDWEPQTNKVSWSEAEFELFGVKRQDVHPSFELFLSLLHPDDRSIAIARVENMKAGDSEFANDMRIIRPDGECIWIHSRARATRDAEGRVVRVEGTDQDITARRLAELSAEEIKKQLQAAVEVAGLGIIAVDYGTQTVDMSHRAAEQFGFPPGMPVTRTELQGRIHPDDQAELNRLTENARRGADTGWFAQEHRVVWPDGTIRWLHVRKQVSFSNGHPHKSVIVTFDVTDRKRSEEAVRASEARYRLLFESNPHPMWVYNTETFKFTAVNDTAVLAYGYSREEFLSMSIRDIRPAEEIPRLEAAVARHSGGTTTSSPWRHQRKDGTVFTVEVSSHDLADEEGKCRLLMALDITERLQAEQARDELLARLQLHIDRMPIAYVLFDAECRYGNWNPAAEKIFGYSREEIIGQPTSFLVHPDDYAHVAEILRRLQSGDVAAQSINRNVTKDGRTIICEWHNTPLFAANGSFLGVLSMTLDITNRVRAEEALRASERRLRLALEAAGSIAFTWDIQNDAVTRYFSTEPGLPVTRETVGTLNEVRNQIHPDDLHIFDAQLSACLKEGVDYRSAFRIIRPDGAIACLEESGYLDRAVDGTPLALTGVSINVTERQAATEALRMSEARYRQLVDLLPTAIFVYAEDKILYGNPAFLKMIGVNNPDELLGRSPFDVTHPSAHDALHQRNELIALTGEAGPGFEKRVLRQDGRSVPVYSVAASISGYGQPATLVAVTDLTERERATQLLRSVLSSVGDAILTIDEQGVIGSANPAAARQFGYSEDELLGQNVSLLMYEPFTQEHNGYLFSYLKTGIAKIIGIGREVECLRRDGTRFSADLTVTEFSLEGERRFTGVLRDITERKRLQSQFIQSQKMEAVGRLAGGVAHDFNNLLTIISGYCELLMMSDLPVGDKRRESIATIRDAGERAARLTQQLLAFSRKAVMEPKLIDLNELVTRSVKLLRRLIGEDIILAVVTAPHSVPIKADPGQMEQVIMNLVVNARDAMPTGGRLTIETSIVGPDEHSPNGFARLAVSDTGQGITDDVKEKIFEPFFTTKRVGKGTGLGLAVVHGIVTQSGGQILIESAVGAGTTFQILLPLIANSGTKTVVNTTIVAIRGTETLLLVEDDKAVRRITRISLQTHGYTVLEASDGLEALHQAETYPGEIHLLVSDVVMPEMGGRQLLDAVRKHRPGLRVLFMSGYTDDAVLLHGVVEATDAFIQKPFTPLTLARKVREVIDAS